MTRKLVKMITSGRCPGDLTEGNRRGRSHQREKTTKKPSERERD
jgi:hypothetical protein